MRKPSTPDPIKMIYLQGEQNRRIKTPKIYPTTSMMNNNKKKIYTFAMNGQTGKMVGDLPVDWGAFWRYFAISKYCKR